MGRLEPANAHEILNMAREFLCGHMEKRILSYITRNFEDFLKHNGAKVMLILHMVMEIKVYDVYLLRSL